MPFFETSVQEIKYKVLKKVAELAYEDQLLPENMLSIPEEIIPEGKPTMRCCIYKERAIINQRVSAAIGGGGHSRRNVRVLPIACDECPIEGIQVTHSCHGCIARYCANTCPKDAISIVNLRAQIDKTKCVECGQCLSACSYSAIVRVVRPCVEACKTRAIEIDPDSRKARINEEKCVSCGACVYQCPWGALTDKSFILDAIKLLRLSERVYAIVAPAIVSQFTYAKPGQVITAIKALGFCKVVEAALGADMVAYAEAAELAERGFLTSSCCPAFVSLVKKQYPTLAENVSHNMSPMATIAKRIKELDPGAKTVFIGPCTAKKAEFQLPEVHKYVDCVLTFEELQALFDSRDLDVASMEESQLNDASGFGRIFAHCGGLATAAAEALKEQGSDFDLKPISCDGLEECRAALLKASKGKLDANFVEGMACIGGCVNGAGNMVHAEANRVKVDAFSRQAQMKSIKDSLDTAVSEFDPVVADRGVQ